MLDLAEQLKIKIIPVDLRWQNEYSKSNKNIATNIVKKIIRDYSKHKALLAYGICDEPKSDKFPKLRASSDIFKEFDPIHPPLINLFPSYGSPAQLGFADFREYVHNFIEIVQPAVLSYDHYSLRENNSESGWHKDLEIVRDEARKANIPFWIFIQSEGIKNYLRVPNRAEILWQANTALAYGARGILWFCYWTPPTSKLDGKIIEAHYSAMIDKNGKRTKVYNYVREENLFLRKAGKKLSGWENTAVSRFKNGKLESGSNISMGKFTGNNSDLIVGTFEKNDSVRLVCANNSARNNSTFVIVSEPGWKFSEIIEAIDSTAIRGKNSAANLNYNLNPGGCVVVEYVRKR